MYKLMITERGQHTPEFDIFPEPFFHKSSVKPYMQRLLKERSDAFIEQHKQNDKCKNFPYVSLPVRMVHAQKIDQPAISKQRIPDSRFDNFFS
jgi:hypothetical protein